MTAPLALHRFAAFTAASAFVLLFAGGLVTSTGSSLAVPDWPLSFGRAMPPLVGGVLFEHGHRMIAAAVGLLTLALTAWTLLAESRAWVRRLAYAAAAAIVVQALLGGLTVLLRLPPAVSISHACLGQATFCLLLCVAQATSPGFSAARPAAEGAWKGAAAAAAAVYLQLFLGAVLRHTGEGLAWHLAGAAVVSALVARLARVARRERALKPLAAPLAACLGLQLLLGYGAYRVKFAPDFAFGFRPEALLPTAHLAVGAALLGLCVAAALRAARPA